MDTDILDTLEDIGYEGDLTNETLAECLQLGPSSLTYTKLVSYVVKELCDFYDIEEAVNPVTDDNNAESTGHFLMELSGFLRAYGCPHTKLTEGPLEARLSDRMSRLLLLDYLLTELQAAQIYFTDKPLELSKNKKSAVEELTNGEHLKQMCIALQFPKPPATITAFQLFSKIEAKISELIAKFPNAVGEPLLKANLSQSQWDKVSLYNDRLTDEYTLRREMLLKRLDVTIQSFLWSDKVKLKQDEALQSYQPLRLQLKTKAPVCIANVLAARDFLLINEKTNLERASAETHIKKVIIGEVPDRGGRTGGMSAPAPEMPSFKKRQADTAPMGQRPQSGRGGRGGRVQGGWSGGDRNKGKGGGRGNR